MSIIWTCQTSYICARKCTSISISSTNCIRTTCFQLFTIGFCSFKSWTCTCKICIWKALAKTCIPGTVIWACCQSSIALSLWDIITTISWSCHATLSSSFINYSASFAWCWIGWTQCICIKRSTICCVSTSCTPTSCSSPYTSFLSGSNFTILRWTIGSTSSS